MAEFLVDVGHDTYIDEAKPNRAFGDQRYLLLSNKTDERKRVILNIDPGPVLGRTVLASVLSLRVKDAVAGQTITVQAIGAGRANTATVTWDSAPAVTGPTASVTIGAVPAGGRIEIPVTALVQAIADGGPRFGWRITTSTNAGATLMSFDVDDATQLLTAVSEASDAPAKLAPAGQAVSLAKPLLRGDWVDLDGATDCNAVQVQVDPAGSAGTAWDSGTVATTLPRLDLAGTTYPGLANHASTKWRMRVRSTTTGAWSEWSDWVEFTRDVKANLSLTSPAGGTLWDPTVLIAGTVDAGTLLSVVVDAFDVLTGSVRYTQAVSLPSGATSFAVQMPFLSNPPKGQRPAPILLDGRAYGFRARAVDRVDRAYGGPGDPPYLEAVVTATFSQDGTISPATDLQVLDGAGSGARVRFKRAAAPDSFAIFRDGVRIARPAAADIFVSGTTYEWRDRDCPPNQTSSYRVRAVTQASPGNPRESPSTDPVDFFNAMEGLWLITSEAGSVKLLGREIRELRRQEKRITFDQPFRSSPMSIRTAPGGLTGPVTVYLKGGQAPTKADRVVLDAIARGKAGDVTLVYGTTVIPAAITNLSVVDDPRTAPAQGDYRHAVSFQVDQCGDFDRVA